MRLNWKAPAILAIMGSLGASEPRGWGPYGRGPSGPGHYRGGYRGVSRPSRVRDALLVLKQA